MPTTPPGPARPSAATTRSGGRSAPTTCGATRRAAAAASPRPRCTTSWLCATAACASIRATSSRCASPITRSARRATTASAAERIGGRRSAGGGQEPPGGSRARRRRKLGFPGHRGSAVKGGSRRLTVVERRLRPRPVPRAARTGCRSTPSGEWRRVAPVLHRRKLLGDDAMATLEAYCLAVGAMRQYAATMDAEGQVIQTERRAGEPPRLQASWPSPCATCGSTRPSWA